MELIDDKFHFCDECDKPMKRVVLLGEPINWESATALVCADCLRRALSLIEEELPSKTKGDLNES